MKYLSDISKVTRTEEAADFPAVVLVDNCSACNLRCSICDHKNIRKHRPIETMPWQLYCKIIDEVAAENPHARVWEIFFGDPCLCADMPWRIRYAKDAGLTDVVLNTNGVLLDEEKTRAYISAGLDALYIGIDAATRPTYEKIRVGGDFDAAVTNTLRYRQLLDEIGRPDQKVFVQFVVSELNADEVRTFKDFWAENDVPVKIRPKVSWAGLVPAENLRDNRRVDRKPCYWLMRTINICTNGDVALCSVDVHCRVRCGNVAETSIRDVWAGLLAKYRAMQRDGHFERLPNLCRRCGDWQSTYAEFA